MEREQVRQICEYYEVFHMSRVVLTMPIPKNGCRGEKVRTPFGLGEIYNINEETGRVVFSVDIAQVRRWLKRTEAASGKQD